ncbi:MAG TPA: flagellar basal body-associated FliL family protein [Geminicoccus sp.]|jgi:flagellar FliL protein|uniref:flagellar basal body-associated FliL family protein n=1 Tax=Geminicoccus sp. TaxID=2024832 RepID=UPI002E31AC5E|nr:flagellar basal body-associated FliL family protein [Geminicoccus sp.]HEX2529622.1 flagellar basal body-associated FliL family protein [Geminicoccus sp.]
MADKTKGPEAAEKPAGGKKKVILLALVGLIVLGGGGGAAAYMLGLFGSAPPVEQASEQLAPEAAAASPEEHQTPADAPAGEDGHALPSGPVGPKVIFVDLPDVLVNLSSDSKRMRFLKLRLAVEVSAQPVADTVVQLTPRIMDSFQLYLRGLTVDDLSGPAALHRLKQEMLARINLALEPSRIDDVLFKEMLVQ